jgi:hypothetical protein
LSGISKALAPATTVATGLTAALASIGLIENGLKAISEISTSNSGQSQAKDSRADQSNERRRSTPFKYI